MSFRNDPQRHRPLLFGAAAGAALLGIAMAARAELPALLQNVVGASSIEAALFRVMDLPGTKALYPRPPKEAQAELQRLLAQDAQQAELYRLKATEDEQALDFSAAETDWKAYAAHAKEIPQAKLQLADFYHRRLQRADEVRVLLEAGAAPPAVDEKFVAADQQQSWSAFSRIITVAKDNAMDASVSQGAYEAWLVRYPKEPSVYAMYFNWLLEAKQYDAAASLVARYKSAFPTDAVFPVKATALLELRRGSLTKALSVYDASFQPLWPQELLDSYFSLLATTHQQRSFAGAATARLQKNPEDFDALCRLYFYQQESGRGDAAQALIDQYRLAKDSRKSPWSAPELFTLMSLMQRSGTWPEAARYAFALYSLPANAVVSGHSAQETGLAALIDMLLKQPDQPLLLGAQNLSMYRDIATIDQGPGYWNGVLSLWLNSSAPEQEYHREETKAQPYFHRAKAAQLLQLLDAKFPQAEARSSLHASLISAYADYDENAEVIKAGTAYLQQFPHGAERVSVAMQMADAYSRQNDTRDEFALYDAILPELGAKTDGMPLTAQAATKSSTAESNEREAAASPDDENASADASADGENPKASAPKSAAFEIHATPAAVHVDGAAEYSQVLERYLGRLVMTDQMQAALAVLRKELDRNPNEPLLYERLAQFLAQNKLDAQQEEVYKTAMARFPDKSWYDKLARLYLREKRNDAYAELTRQVTTTFEGTDLEAYFRNAGGVGPQMSLQLNLYAAQRFPHDLVFVRNLLELYETNPTRDPAARLALLRAHWWEANDLQTEFFATLSRSGSMDAELQQLQGADARQDPAAGRELAEVQMWRGHFEESAAPLSRLADLYPADVEIGESAASVFRSLAYYDGTQTAKAIAAEKNLLAVNPGDLNRLATIGDIYADAGAAGTTGHEDLISAEPYWRRMAEVAPGSKDGYLQAATIFWDYFEFDKALDEIHAARAKFGDATLFGYEAGAICEGKRDSQCAVQEYAAAAVQDNSDARFRLLELAPRPAFSSLVDESMVSAGNSDNAMMLREDVLHAQDKDAAIAPLLEAELARATTPDEVAALAERAKSKDLAPVYERALEKETTLAVDPVQKIELQYALARSEEGRNDVQDAAHVIAAVYADNPKLLGVVRATVDFDWRIGAREHAITVLMEASKGARPDLGRQFALEAAAKANEAGEYARARDITTPLLGVSPYDSQLIALAADSFARAGDDAGLRDFYSRKLETIQTATMTADARKQTILLLRRGLIPALTRMKDYSGATQQYIAMLSAYPEDSGLTQEASLYALRWQQKDVLTGFVQRTVEQSPKDSRFAAMLAQILTIFEDDPAAIQAWAHAVSIRPDRQEWFAAKADLESRLGRLDDACLDDERLYVLSYKDPQWMVAVAEIRAQQGRRDDAVAALQRAWISGHTATAADDFKVSDQLMRWNMLAESKSFAEQGVKLAGGALLIDDPDGAVVYMKVMTRLRQTDAALTALNKALDAASISSNSPTIVAEQVAKQGIASVTDAEWRQKQAQQRNDAAHSSYDRAMDAMAGVVTKYYAPEEKSQFALLIQKSPMHTDRARVAGLAGLKDLEAALRKEKVMQVTNKISPEFNKWIDLQRSRMLFDELAHTAEAYATALSPRVNRSEVKLQAASAYRDAGDEVDELRVTAALQRSHGDAGLQNRLFALLLRHDLPQLLTLAGHKNALGDAAANYALAHAEEPVALKVLAARGAAMEPVWKSSYRALTGLYFGDTGTETDAAFQSALSNATIGDRLGHAADRTQALAGDPWFYYGMRYAVFRLNGGPGDAEDYAASELEHGASFENYVNLAQAYADAGKVDAAIVEYRHALELQPDTASVHDAIALLLWKTGRHDDAINEWQAALVLLRKMIDRQAVPEDFFTTTETIARHAKACGIVSALRVPLSEVLKTYLAKNDNYRSNELLHALFDASASPADGAAWIVEVSAASKQQEQILADIDGMAWMGKGARVSLLLKRLQLVRAAANANSNGTSAEAVATIQGYLVTLYVELKDDAAARAMLAQIPEASRQTEELVIARVTLAAHDASLKSLLDGFASMPDLAQSNLDSLHAAADALVTDGDEANARLVLEVLFERAMLRHELTSTDYLGLAEARIKTDDLSGALDLLRRMTMLASDHGRYANDDLAASLLETSGHWAEAIPFLKTLAAGEPWNAESAVRLAEAQLKAAQDAATARASLIAIGSSAVTPYEMRARAALDLRGGETASLGSKELDLLAAKTVTPENARQSYFVKARMAAAGVLSTPTTLLAKQRESLLREALAIEPGGVDTNAIRVAIFKANAELNQNALAMAAIKPLLADLQGTTAQPADDAGEGTDSGDQESDTEQPAKPQFDVAQRAALLAAISDVSWSMGNGSNGVTYLRTAVRLAPKSPQYGAWQQKLAQRRSIIRRAQANQARRPLIHSPLDQEVAVRPRLMAAKEAR